MTLSDWISSEPGRASRLAEALGLSNPSNPVLVYQWANGVRPVPAARCPAIERATAGAVTCEELNAEVDWAVLRQSAATKRPAKVAA
jgi:DNA-binding transcriptional regulator YdaS (Cro superfamily)